MINKFLRKMIPLTDPPSEIEALEAEQELLTRTRQMKHSHPIRKDTQRQIEEVKKAILDNGEDEAWLKK